MVKSNKEPKTKTGQIKKPVTTRKTTSSSTVRYLFIAVLVLVLMVVGINIYKKLPQVSDQTIHTISMEYYKSIEGLNSELTQKYTQCFEAKDLDSWKAFSESWIPRIGAGKPELFQKRLTKESSQLVDEFEFLNRDLFQIWTVYNASMESGNPIKEAEAKSLLESIESFKTSIKSKLQ